MPVGQRSRSQGLTVISHTMCHSYRTGDHTILKLCGNIVPLNAIYRGYGHSVKGQKPQSHGEHVPSLSACAVLALNAKTKDCRKFK